LVPGLVRAWASPLVKAKAGRLAPMRELQLEPKTVAVKRNEGKVNGCSQKKIKQLKSNSNKEKASQKSIPLWGTRSEMEWAAH